MRAADTATIDYPGLQQILDASYGYSRDCLLALLANRGCQLRIQPRLIVRTYSRSWMRAAARDPCLYARTGHPGSAGSRRELLMLFVVWPAPGLWPYGALALRLVCGDWRPRLPFSSSCFIFPAVTVNALPSAENADGRFWDFGCIICCDGRCASTGLRTGLTGAGIFLGLLEGEGKPTV